MISLHSVTTAQIYFDGRNSADTTIEYLILHWACFCLISNKQREARLSDARRQLKCKFLFPVWGKLPWLFGKDFWVDWFRMKVWKTGFVTLNKIDLWLGFESPNAVRDKEKYDQKYSYNSERQIFARSHSWNLNINWVEHIVRISDWNLKEEVRIPSTVEQRP